jgi:hypothetical protein
MDRLLRRPLFILFFSLLFDKIYELILISDDLSIPVNNNP